MVDKGQQIVLTNNFDQETKFYHFIMAETNIRSKSIEMSNVYFLVLFACCREHYNRSKTGMSHVVPPEPNENWNLFILENN